MDSSRYVMTTRALSVHTPRQTLIRNVELNIERGRVLGIIGPSGAGKSTFLRTLNRLVDLISGLRVTGDVLLEGQSVYAPGVDVNALRARVGMLFQQPVIFPTSIGENVVFGAKHLRRLSRDEKAALIEEVLREAALWDEVKDRLRSPAQSLSVGQQQRLCLARTLAVRPEVILMDEPTSALDPRSTAAIEELIGRLRGRHTVVLVTHNVGQARRVADYLVCLCVREGAGEVVEHGTSAEVLDSPQSKELVEYLAHAG